MSSSKFILLGVIFIVVSISYKNFGDKIKRDLGFSSSQKDKHYYKETEKRKVYKKVKRENLKKTESKKEIKKAVANKKRDTYPKKTSKVSIQKIKAEKDSVKAEKYFREAQLAFKNKRYEECPSIRVHFHNRTNNAHRP